VNKAGEFNLNSMVIGLVLAFGLLFAVVGGSINAMGGTYDSKGFNETELTSYNHLDSLESRIVTNADSIEGTNVDKGVFDWFAGLWEKIKSPFTFVVQSYKTLITVTNQASDKFDLMPEFKQALSTIIVMLVVIGILAGRYFLGRK